MWAVKKIRFFIWGRPIRIVTDHHARSCRMWRSHGIEWGWTSWDHSLCRRKGTDTSRSRYKVSGGCGLTCGFPPPPAREVADFSVHDILLRHGAPRSLTTDQGKCFVARMMQGILQVLQTNHRTTTAYHQQANGQVERLNYTFADMLSMYVSADHSDWDSALPYVRFA